MLNFGKKQTVRNAAGVGGGCWEGRGPQGGTPPQRWLWGSAWWNFLVKGRPSLQPAALSARRAHPDQAGWIGRVWAAVQLVGKGRLGPSRTTRFLQAVSSPERGIRPTLMRSPSFRPAGSPAPDSSRECRPAGTAATTGFLCLARGGSCTSQFMSFPESRP